MPLASGTTAKCLIKGLPQLSSRAEILLNELQSARILLAELGKRIAVARVQQWIKYSAWQLITLDVNRWRAGT